MKSISVRMHVRRGMREDDVRVEMAHLIGILETQDRKLYLQNLLIMNSKGEFRDGRQTKKFYFCNSYLR